MLSYLSHLKGGVYTEGDVAMTAFVLSALAECKCTGMVSDHSLNVKLVNTSYSVASIA